MDGQVQNCNEWNTIVEEVLTIKKEKYTGQEKSKINTPQIITQISLDEDTRMDTNDQEPNRVLGGGIVAGSLILLGVEPGIGKSTLILQLAIRIKNQQVLYVSGEESDKQIKLRADRLGLKNANCHILTETNTQNLFQQAVSLSPLLVIDSIQTLQSNTIESLSR